MTFNLSTLISLLSLAIVLCGVVPLYPWLSGFPRIALASGLAFAIWQKYRSIPPLNNWVLNSAVVPVFIYYVAQFSRTDPVTPVVSLLAWMKSSRKLTPFYGTRFPPSIPAADIFCCTELLRIATLIFSMPFAHGGDKSVK
jgi:hypothetical protein